MRPHLLALLWAAIMSLVTAGPASADILLSYDPYDRWFLACDNALRCEARGISDRNRDPHLSVLREAGPEGDMTVTIAAAFRFTAADLALDGVPLALDAKAWTLERHARRTLLKSHQADAAQAFIRRIRNGRFLEFQDRTDRVPLSGLTASLLRMDEQQQRLGTRTALIRRGNAPADSVPAPPPLPSFDSAEAPPPLTPEEEAELLDRVQAFHADPLDDRCYGAMHLMTPIGPSAWPIDESHALVAVPCTLTNIWQLQSFVYVAERKEQGAITLFQPVLRFTSQAHPVTLRALSEPDFEPSTGRLFVSQKSTLSSARCGHAGEWQWQEGQFVLARFTRQSHCGGNAPGDWPVLYRSEMNAR